MNRIRQRGGTPAAAGAKGRRARRQGGGVAIEFALLLIPLMLILTGIIDYGFALFSDIQITNAARVGARAAASGEDGEARAAQYLATAGLIGDAQVTVQTVGDEVDVQVDYDFVPLVGFVPTPDSIHARAVMRLELVP